ncbi:MAG: Jag N-terminal domain-containing protein [Deltaproteobacteria bacterium]|nr:Jag N-terminal domain-containing protein [Deltaproteobacteria bacterium]
MREAIFEGKDEEEALLKASTELGVNIRDMTYEVVEVETGLFGLFGKSVKVRVRVADEPQQFVLREGVEPDAMRASLGRQTREEADEPPPRRAVPREPVVKGPEARDALAGVLLRMGIAAEVTLKEDDESVGLNVHSDDQASVVGRDGETLAALQFIVNKMVNRFPESRKLVTIDAEGFRDRREEELTKLAISLAEKAIAAGKAVRLSPMNAVDRRFVHVALKGRPGITTRSEGEGAFRCLLIVPDGVRERPRDPEPPRDRGPREFGPREGGWGRGGDGRGGRGPRRGR